MKVLFAGGGTGGHIYPAITIAKALLREEPNAEVLFVGTKRGLEAELVPRAGFPIEFITVTYFRRKISPQLLKAGYLAWRALAQSVRVLRRFRPDVVVGTGGYVAGPVVLAAVILRIPSMIQEQNALPGATNRVLSRLVAKVALGYEEAASYLGKKEKLVFTGNPIRPEILEVNRQEGAEKLGLDPGRRLVVVFGASQGAKSINRAMVESRTVYQGRPDLQILHATGNRDFEATIRAYGLEPSKPPIRLGNITIVPYIYDMPHAYAAADLVVGRAGALSIAEMTARGIPGILIPYPFAAENHQEKNARVLERAGAAKVISDKDLNGKTLAEAILSLLSDQKGLWAMAEASRKLGRPDAAARIVEVIKELG